VYVYGGGGINIRALVIFSTPLAGTQAPRIALNGDANGGANGGVNRQATPPPQHVPRHPKLAPEKFAKSSSGGNACGGASGMVCVPVPVVLADVRVPD